MSENFKMVAKTFQGLEGVLSDELTALGAADVEQGRRMVSFTGDKAMLYRANLCLRTALRILVPFHTFESNDADDLYEQVKQYPWEEMLTSSSTFSIDTTVFSEHFRHSRFVTYRVKDAIVDYFKEREGRRPSIRLNAPDRIFNVHISGNQVTISLDSSGEPLFKRGWRVAQTEAPINAVLAAGIIKLSGWDGQCDLIDPMCGSGTFLIEAALIAANINPGIYRDSFAFQQWKDYDADLFSELYDDDSGEREFTHKIYGSDIMAKAIAISEANVKRAGMGKYIQLERKALEDWTEAPEKGMVITNPPYGERLVVGDIESLYQTLGQKIKHVFRGYEAWVICADDRELYSNIGLKASVHYPLLNGDIECELRQYKSFDGSYNEMRERGENIKNENFRASDRFERGDRHPRREFHDRDRRDDRRDDRPRRDFDRDRDRDRRDDRPRRDYDHERDRRPYAERGRGADGEEGNARWHDRPIHFREPRLGKDAERPIFHGRRKGWKRRDIDLDAPGTPGTSEPPTDE